METIIITIIIPCLNADTMKNCKFKKSNVKKFECMDMDGGSMIDLKIS